MALFGENPNKRESRLFCSHSHGAKFVRGIAGEGANIFEYDYDASQSQSGESQLSAEGIANFY